MNLLLDPIAPVHGFPPTRVAKENLFRQEPFVIQAELLLYLLELSTRDRGGSILDNRFIVPPRVCFSAIPFNHSFIPSKGRTDNLVLY
jgi:hypothetical protein